MVDITKAQCGENVWRSTTQEGKVLSECKLTYVDLKNKPNLDVVLASFAKFAIDNDEVEVGLTKDGLLFSNGSFPFVLNGTNGECTSIELIKSGIFFFGIMDYCKEEVKSNLELSNDEFVAIPYSHIEELIVEFVE
jgi:hypothetical protein